MIEFIKDFFYYENSFYAGNALLVIGSLLSSFDEHSLMKSSTRILLIIGSLLIVFSPLPISNPFFRFQMLLILSLLISLHFGSRALAPGRVILRLLIAGTCAYSIYKFNEPVKEIDSHNRQVFVIGSSLTDQENSWVITLDKHLKNKSINLSTEDNNLDHVLEQAGYISDKNAIIIIEAGMQEVEGGIPLEQFTMQFTEVAVEVSRAKRDVIMFELPTSILQKKYLAVQKEVAGLHGITLLPRSYLYRAIDKHSLSKAPVRLSNEGQALLAGALTNIINTTSSFVAKK